MALSITVFTSSQPADNAVFAREIHQCRNMYDVLLRILLQGQISA